jgi:hypothetical protein
MIILPAIIVIVVSGYVLLRGQKRHQPTALKPQLIEATKPHCGPVQSLGAPTLISKPVQIVADKPALQPEREDGDPLATTDPLSGRSRGPQKLSAPLAFPVPVIPMLGKRREDDPNYKPDLSAGWPAPTTQLEGQSNGMQSAQPAADHDLRQVSPQRETESEVRSDGGEAASAEHGSAAPEKAPVTAVIESPLPSQIHPKGRKIKRKTRRKTKPKKSHKRK